MDSQKADAETPHANKIRRLKKSHSLLMGMQNDTVTSEESLAVSYKTKHTFALAFSSHDSWYLSKGAENMLMPKPLYMDICGRGIQLCPTL